MPIFKAEFKDIDYPDTLHEVDYFDSFEKAQSFVNELAADHGIKNPKWAKSQGGGEAYFEHIRTLFNPKYHHHYAGAVTKIKVR